MFAEGRRALVRAGWVLSMGPQGDVRDGAVLLREGSIEAVDAFERLHRAFPEVEVIGDGTGVVTPGLINTHTHLSEALVPGMGSELTLFEWGRSIVGPVGEHLTREMAREGAVLKSIEMLHSGVTCVNDMFVHANPGSFASLGIVEGLRRAGLRGVVSFGAEDRVEGAAAMAPMAVDDIVAEHEALADLAASSPLMGFRLGIGTLLGQTDELLARGVALCRTHGWGVHTHLAEVREEVVQASLRWGRRTVDHAKDVGLLEHPVIAGHGIWLTERDVATLADHRVAIAHNPVANMILGSGVCRVQRLRAAGITVGIGTDGAASNDSQNMLEAIKAAPLLQKVTALDPAVMSARDTLELATREGARAIGLEDAIGSLEPGKRADLVRFAGTIELATIHDPYQQVVYCASPRSVADVWVDGRRLLADGVPTELDEAAAIASCRPLAVELAERAGLVGSGASWLRTT